MATATPTSSQPSSPVRQFRRRPSPVRLQPGQLTPGRYEQSGNLGTGTYGRVIRCTDATTNEPVAIKIVNPQPAYRRSAIAEITVLNALQHSPTVLKMRDHFDADGRVHIVSELLYRNLYQISSAANFERIPLQHVRPVGDAVLKALAELHEIGYIHCDVKPENVMLRRKKGFEDCCLIDFGSVRKYSENMYYDVQSLWYRAPEVICGVPYTTKIDSWSVGCLLFELHTGSPLFPSDSPQDALSRIISVVGMPGQHAVRQGTNSPNLEFTPHPGTQVNPLLENIGTTEADMVFRDLIVRLLHPDENQRLSAHEALNHPFITGMPACYMAGKSPAANSSMSGYGSFVGGCSTEELADPSNHEVSQAFSQGSAVGAPIHQLASPMTQTSGRSPTITPPLPVDEWDII